MSDSPQNCPRCDANLDGGPIPKDRQEFYSPPYRWSRAIGLYDTATDRVTEWECPDCHHRWPRQTFAVT